MVNKDLKLVCCRNVNIIAKYVKKTLGSDVLLWQDLPESKDYLIDENNWVTLATFTQIINRAADLLKDKNAVFNMGTSAVRSGSWGAFRFLVNIFASAIFGPVEVYRQVGKYNEFFNKTKDMVVVRANKNSCLIKIKFKNGVNPVDDYLSDLFIQGILASVPEIWHLPFAELKEPLYEHEIKYLLTKVGGIKPEAVQFVNNTLLINGEEYGHRVALIPDEINHEPVYFGRYGELNTSLDESVTGILITKDFIANEKLTIKTGQIYNAPYFIFQMKWQEMNFWQKIIRMVFYSFASKKSYREGIETQLATIKNYVETLEEKVVERTSQLEAARKDSEYWRHQAENLLNTMLPENIKEKMMQGKLKTEKIHGTIVFTDLAGFTSYSNNLDPAQVSQDLTGYFTDMSRIITEHGGWVNKFLGDGILAIFGLNGEENYTEQAIKASIKMHEAVKKYPWGKRIGVATGHFITGEFGTESLRRFDCLGNIVNLASRLQGHAGEGEILVCADTHGRVSDKFKFCEPIKISPKGIGEIEVYRVFK